MTTATAVLAVLVAVMAVGLLALIIRNPGPPVHPAIPTAADLLPRDYQCPECDRHATVLWHTTHPTVITVHAEGTITCLCGHQHQAAADRTITL